MQGLYLSNQQLRQCEQLKYMGLAQSFEVGAHIGRCFADLGFEQFVTLPDGQILSLFTGHKSQPGEHKEQHFFLVPAVDDLLNFLAQQGCLIQKLGADPDQCWHIALQCKGRIISDQANSLWQVLIDASLQVGEQIANASLN